MPDSARRGRHGSSPVRSGQTAGHAGAGGADRTEDIPFTIRVQRLVRRIPPGRVLAYGDVAALLGAPRAARGVGHVLSSLPQGSDVPWWRVVNARGSISLHGHPGLLQRMMLEAEGVRFGRGGRIDWELFGWRP